MKIGALLLLFACAAQGALRADEDDTDCITKHRDADSCNDDDACVWCEAKAIPSECVTKDQAAHLPPGVFECANEHMQKGVLDVTMDSSVRGHFDVNGLGLEDEPLCDADVKQAAGYFRLHDANKHYFFWYFESRNDPQNDPVVLWLTGGPGCSSSLALLVENGPCQVKKAGDGVERNPYSWNNNATIIFVDSPPGTGWSYGTLDVTERQVGIDLYSFLLEFMERYPQYAKLPLHVYAESYGGKWAPNAGAAINAGNKKAPKDKQINLRTIGIGNGLTKPETQVKWYADMAYKSGTAPSRVSTATYSYMKYVATPAAFAVTHACNALQLFPVCAAAQSAWTLGLMAPIASAGWNHYNLKIKCEVPGLCYDFSAVSNWLNSEEVQRKLGVDRPWTECARAPAVPFAGEEMKNVDQLLPPLLADGIKVLIYAGDVDYICNWLGNKAWTLELDWPQREAFNAAEDKPYEMDGKTVGKERTVGGFTFLQVFDAGHMVPMDQPQVALHMLNDFINRD